jgi:hypothetical protein
MRACPVSRFPVPVPNLAAAIAAMCDAVTVDPPGSRLCIGRAQDLDVLLRHRLLRQPGGYEGIRAVEVDVTALRPHTSEGRGGVAFLSGAGARGALSDVRVLGGWLTAFGAQLGSAVIASDDRRRQLHVMGLKAARLARVRVV